LRRIRLWHVNVLLFAAALALGWVYRGQLPRAYDGLNGYLDGNLVAPLESSLHVEAIGLLQRGVERDRARELLEQAVAIDPNSSTVYVLGDVLLMEGDLESALALHLRYNEIDPSFYPAYLSIASIYAAQNKPDAQREILERGVEHFRRELDNYRPREDATVSGHYNHKARAVYNYYREALAQLEREL